VTLALDSRAKELVSQGVDVVNFTVGEPDFDTPDHIATEGIRAIKAGFTRYTGAAGIPELRRAICKKLKRDNGLSYEPDQVMATIGGKGALANAILALCDPGDEVIIPVPYWVSYPEQVLLAGGKPVPAAPADGGLKLRPGDLERALTPRTRLVILNSPNNPSGCAYTAEELEALSDVILNQSDAYILSDEVYEYLIYDGRTHVSVAALGEDHYRRTIVINALSKSYAMTGWRIGYAAGPREVIKAMASVQSHLVSHTAAFVQRAAVLALNGPQTSVAEMVAEFERRRDYMAQRLAAMPAMQCRVPEGAFYLFPDISALFGRTLDGAKIENSMDFCQALLDKARVAIAPGAAFGNDRHVRFSYATSMETIVEGMNRLEELLNSIDK